MKSNRIARLFAVTTAALPVAACLFLARSTTTRQKSVLQTTPLSAQQGKTNQKVRHGKLRANYTLNNVRLFRVRGSYIHQSGTLYINGPHLKIDYNSSLGRWELIDAEVPAAPDILYSCESSPLTFPLEGWEMQSGDAPPPTFAETLPARHEGEAKSAP